MFGSKLVLHRAFDVDLAFADITAHKATIFDGVPALDIVMLNSPALKSATLSSLTHC